MAVKLPRYSTMLAVWVSVQRRLLLREMDLVFLGKCDATVHELGA